jgi:hypothetical protein
LRNIYFKSFLDRQPVSSSLNSSPSRIDPEMKAKYERLQLQLHESQAKIVQLTNQLKQQQQQKSVPTTTPSSDLDDDLARVLISKEEVITQLERQLYEKEKHVQHVSKQLNEEIAASHKYQDALNAEVSRSGQIGDHYADKMAKCAQVIAQHEMTINQLHNEKSKYEIELKSLQEYSRNEIETLQEEIKTLEYKLVFSQRQAQEYQSILENMDATNANSVNFLSQLFVSLGGSLSSIGINESWNLSELGPNASLHARLTHNQTKVNQLMQHVIDNHNSTVEELKQRIDTLQNELDECKEENVELNDHIYSIDVYMREKETEAEKLQKEKDDLEAELNMVKAKSEKLTGDKSNNEAQNENNSNKSIDKTGSSYKKMLVSLNEQLISHTQNANEFLFAVANLSHFLLNQDGEDTVEDCTGLEANLHSFVKQTLFNANNIASSVDFDLIKFKKFFTNKFNLHATKSQLINIKLSLKKLIKFLNSTELNQFNGQIISYMAEQLIHKSALNGHLKFACELLRNKFESPTSISTQGGSAVNNSVSCSSQSILAQATSSTSLSSSLSQSSSNAAQFKLNINEQDEKIFKLASELLLSDEDSLRKLSTQVLNEAQHLNQLSCVLSTLKKFRWKHLSSNQSLDLIKKAYDSVKQQSDLNNSESDFDEIENLEAAGEITESNASGKINYILEGKSSFEQSFDYL